MRISTKGRYALRLMLDLAVNGKDNYISIKNISTRQEISDKYLEQIINQLCKAGFVKSARGANGGYRLSREPKDYTVGMILNVMEGNAIYKSSRCIAIICIWTCHEELSFLLGHNALCSLFSFFFSRLQYLFCPLEVVLG